MADETKPRTAVVTPTVATPVVAAPPAPVQKPKSEHPPDKTVPAGVYIVKKGNNYFVVDCDGKVRKDYRLVAGSTTEVEKVPDEADKS